MRQQIRGVAMQRRSDPHHPVQGELTLAPLEMADLLRRRVDQLREPTLRQAPSLPTFFDPVRKRFLHGCIVAERLGVEKVIYVDFISTIC